MKRFFTIMAIIAILAITKSFFAQTPTPSHSDPVSAVKTEVSASGETQSSLSKTEQIKDGLYQFFRFSSFHKDNMSGGNFIMIFVGLLFIFLSIKFGYEHLLLIPIGFGVIL
jgi:oxaloacetate decarboxylase beta subunit